MKNQTISAFISVLLLLIGGLSGCKFTQTPVPQQTLVLPGQFANQTDTHSVAQIDWRTYFQDELLIDYIETALQHNQELNVVQQEVLMSQYEVKARKGEYLPFVGVAAGAAVDKPGRYTRFGALEEQLHIKEGEKFPTPFSDYGVGLAASWELDIWKKLRHAKQSAMLRYLASVEGKNFVVTQLVAEIAATYYELTALDNLLEVIEKNINIQSDALKIIRQQKDAAKVSQLAVNRFEAQLLNTKNLRYAVQQNIVIAENRMRFLTGQTTPTIARNSAWFLEYAPDNDLQAGIPSQLLARRPDIRKAEWELKAARIDVKVAQANFYPAVTLRSNVGFQAFNPAYLLFPASILYNLAGDLVAPLVNRNALKANYNTANARQIQALYRYEQAILNGFTDVLNQLAALENYQASYQTKQEQVEILKQSVTIANNLFNAARADYAEVLLTQREALEAKMELIEIKLKLLQARVNTYRALGGGWQ